MTNNSSKTAMNAFLQVLDCEKCASNLVLRDSSFNPPQPGYVGKNYMKNKVLFVGQNPGVSKHPGEDVKYAKHLNDLKTYRSIKAYDKLNEFLREFIPQWLTVKRYSPLDACGLSLDDIAYVNLVRCRTANNATPSKRIISSCMTHFSSILDTLKPQIVVCLGKFANDNTQIELNLRNIPCVYINRVRSQSLVDLKNNIDEVGVFVKQILKDPSAKEKNVSVRKIPKAQKRTPIKKRTTMASKNISIKKPAKDSTIIPGTIYNRIFEKLGFIEYEITKTLKHTQAIPSIYYNRSREQYIYFTAKKQDTDLFPDALWDLANIAQVKRKDQNPRFVNLVPKAHKIKEAFENILP